MARIFGTVETSDIVTLAQKLNNFIKTYKEL